MRITVNRQSVLQGIIAITLLLLLLFFPKYGLALSQADSSVDTKNCFLSPAPHLTEDTLLVQEFKPSYIHLDTIDLLLGSALNAADTNSGVVFLELYNADGTFHYKTSVAVVDIVNDTYCSFPIDANLNPFTTYYFKLYSSSDAQGIICPYLGPGEYTASDSLNTYVDQENITTTRETAEFAYDSLVVNYQYSNAVSVFNGVMLLLFVLFAGVIIALRPTIVTDRFKNILLFTLPAIAILLWTILSWNDHLWYDEAYTLALIKHPFSQLIDITSRDVHPPLYYLCLRLFYLLCGQSIISLKIFSLLFMAGVMLLGLFQIRPLFGNRVAFFYLFLSAVMPCMTLQSYNVRMYSFAMFFILLCAIYAYRFCLKQTPFNLVIFCLAGIIASYTHTFALISIVILYGIMIFYTFYVKKYKQLIPILASGFINALAFLPWLLVLVKQFENRVEIAESLKGIDIYSLIDYAYEWFSTTETGSQLAVLYGIFLILILGYFSFYKMHKEKNYAPMAGLMVFTLVTLIGSVLTIKITPVFIGRYALPCIGLLWFFAAYGMSKIKDVRVVLLLMAVSLMIFTANYKTEYEMKEDPVLDQVMTYMDKNSTSQDAIMVTAEHLLIFNSYLPDYQFFTWGTLPEFLSFENTEAFTDYTQLDAIEGNLWFMCFAGDSPYLMGEHYSYELKLKFKYEVYDMELYKLTKLE